MRFSPVANCVNTRNPAPQAEPENRKCRAARDVGPAEAERILKPQIVLSVESRKSRREAFFSQDSDHAVIVVTAGIAEDRPGIPNLSLKIVLGAANFFAQLVGSYLTEDGVRARMSTYRHALFR